MLFAEIPSTLYLRWFGGIMRTIGIRAGNRGITFAIYDSDNRQVLNVEEIRIPAAFSTPDGLKYLRSNLLDILREFEVEKAGIRVTEALAKSVHPERIQIEGVVQEAFASSKLMAYYTGQIATITTKAGIARDDFKPMVDGEKDPGVANWKKLAKEEREALLCAMGAVNA
ncbi:hypothetical protein [Devosia sp.]|uniref:hypothetical protein n=1 Tax=Devosia sp. TaxID=1871048 RepID=UPI0025B82B2A|nr:hypothetical protein [Devosia sp.]